MGLVGVVGVLWREASETCQLQRAVFTGIIEQGEEFPDAAFTVRRFAARQPSDWNSSGRNVTRDSPSGVLSRKSYVCPITDFIVY